MRRRNTTAFAPLINVNRPVGNAWRWEVLQKIASSGYTVAIHVTAIRDVSGERLVGTAWTDCRLGIDCAAVVEELAVEAMMAACEPQLDGSPTTRRVTVSSAF